ncbi:MAG: DUF4340 domain-containing protein [Gammaproteobacteria bacterium]
MTSRNKINIVLVLMVVALISVLFIDTNKPVKTAFKLSALNETAVNSITITRRTSDTVILKKIKDKWYMTSPYKVRANTFYIESILQITKADSVSEFTISSNDKDKFKLNPPQASLKLNNQLFLFGTNEQLHLNRYILTNNKLYLLPDRYFYLLNITTTGYIDHALIAKDNEIKKIKLANVSIELKKGKWRVSPELKNSSTDDVIQLISEWNNSQVVEINKLTDTNDKPDFNIEVTLNNNQAAIIFNVIMKEDYYLFNRPDLKLSYKLNQDMANRLLQIPNQKIE